MNLEEALAVIKVSLLAVRNSHRFIRCGKLRVLAKSDRCGGGGEVMVVVRRGGVMVHCGWSHPYMAKEWRHWQ